MVMKLLKKTVISPRENGKYKAFPTVVKVSDEIVVAYREGRVDAKTPHGVEGCVRIATSRNLEDWNIFLTPFCDSELDAIVSQIHQDNLFLVTRSYEYRGLNRVYISSFSKRELPPKIRKPIHFEGANFAVFGHIFRYKNELIATSYGNFNGIESPALLASSDLGESWRIKSLITPQGHLPTLNETTVTRKGDEFVAVMRSLEPSYDLYLSKSKNLIDWAMPVKIGIFGHAPMARTLSCGKIAFVFRDLGLEYPGVSIALGSDLEHWETFNICQYTGGLYNGGYADFIEIDPGVLFVVYYVSDVNNEPWIEACTVEI